MPDGPYRSDTEAAMERAVELEAEVERLQAELEAANAAKMRVADDEGEGTAEELKALRVANVSLRRENERLRERLGLNEPKMVQVPLGLALWAILVVAAFVAVMVATCHPR